MTVCVFVRGRLDVNHRSNTAYGSDNYDIDFSPTGVPEDNWRNLIAGHPCYQPGKV